MTEMKRILVTKFNIPDGPINERPFHAIATDDGGFAHKEDLMIALRHVLGGLELGTQDVAILRWLAGFEPDTVATVCSWIRRAREQGAERERQKAMATLDDFGRDIARRCRLVTARGEDGHPFGTWSTGEQLAVAVVLDDREHLNAMGYTLEEASRSVRDRMMSPPANMAAWVTAVRYEMEKDSREAPTKFQD